APGGGYGPSYEFKGDGPVKDPLASVRWSAGGAIRSLKSSASPSNEETEKICMAGITALKKKFLTYKDLCAKNYAIGKEVLLYQRFPLLPVYQHQNHDNDVVVCVRLLIFRVSKSKWIITIQWDAKDAIDRLYSNLPKPKEITGKICADGLETLQKIFPTYHDLCTKYYNIAEEAKRAGGKGVKTRFR
ncbi:hypothetical protein FOZ63_011070, partial [Perkinsus olseni]